MSTPTIYTIAAVTSSFVLTSTVFAQHRPQARLHLTLELDPALAMGPRVDTVIPIRVQGDGYHYVDPRNNLGAALGATYWNRPYFYWSDGSYNGPTLLGHAAMVADAPRITARTPRSTTVVELALTALQEGRFQDAISLEDQINEGGGVSDRLIVALEGAGRTGEAARLLVERIAGGSEELLRVDRDGLTGRAGQVRRMQGKAAQYATDSGDTNALVLLASHMIGQGRIEEAGRAIDRAILAGLAPEAAQVLEQFRVQKPDASSR